MAPEPPAATNIFAPRCLPPSTPEGCLPPHHHRHPPPPPRPLRRRRRPRALSLSRDPGGKQWGGGAAVLPPTATTGALWELARAKEGDAPRHGVALGGVVGFAKKGSCGTLVALAPVTSFLPRGSAPAYSRGKFVGSCWWGVKRLSLSLSLFSSVSWRRESRTAAAAAATAPPARRSWSWWRCGAAGFGGGSDRPPAAGGGGDSQAGGWPLVVETAGGLELLAAPRSVPLGPSRHHIPLSTTAVKRDCQPVSTRPGDRLPGVAGPSPHPVFYVPGPTRKPRALLCVCCVKVTAELDLSPPPFFFFFFAPGDFPGRGCRGKLWKGKT